MAYLRVAKVRHLSARLLFTDLQRLEGKVAVMTGAVFLVDGGLNVASAMG